MHPRYLLALAAISVGALGCGEDPPGADAPAASLHARVERSRLFETQRQAKLVLRNDGTSDVTIEEVLLDSPLFETGAAQPRRSVLRAGEVVSMPVDIGPPICDAPSEAADGVAGEVRIGVGGTTVRLPFEEPARHRLADLQAQECDQRRLGEAVELHFGDDVERVSPSSVRTTLEVRRVDGGRSVAVEEVRGSVIFGVATDGRAAPLLTLAADEDVAVAEVVIGAERCDPHALIESKRTFAFPAFVRLDDGAAVRIEVVPEGRLRQELEAVLADCL